MRTRRLALSVTALVTAAVLASCSDSEDSDKEKDAEASPSAASNECEADVKLIGKQREKWKGDAQVDEGEGQSQFYSEHEGKSLTIVVPKEGDPMAVLFDGKDNFTSMEASGIEVADDFSSADVETMTVDPTGKRFVEVIATFDC